MTRMPANNALLFRFNEAVVSIFRRLPSVFRSQGRISGWRPIGATIIPLPLSKSTKGGAKAYFPLYPLRWLNCFIFWRKGGWYIEVVVHNVGAKTSRPYDGFTPGVKLRYARTAANGPWRCLLNEYSHRKRCHQALFSVKCHITQWLQSWEKVLRGFLWRRTRGNYYC